MLQSNSGVYGGPETGYSNRISSKSKGQKIQGCLLMLWMDENASQQSNEKLLTKENLQLLADVTTKQARTVSTWGIETGALNR